jgi:alkaline phosphatase D
MQYQPEPTATFEEWKIGQTLMTSPDDDYVVIFALDGLNADTEYLYRTNASHTGSFRTTERYPKKWTFVSTSCIKPFFPYSPLDHSLRIRGLELLSNYLRTTKVDFMLFLGDFIYVDLPKRFGFTPEHYRRLYRQVYSSPSWSTSLLSLPWLHAYDDHEITNDWSANETGIYKDAIESYMHYQHPVNPDPVVDGGTYYTFQHGDVDFFVMDTRRYRSPALMADGPEKTMLGTAQRRDLEAWLQKDKRWKVIVSSVPFTRNFRGPSSKDSWAGYLWERQSLLERMWGTDGVLIISGVRPVSL